MPKSRVAPTRMKNSPSGNRSMTSLIGRSATSVPTTNAATSASRPALMLVSEPIAKAAMRMRKAMIETDMTVAPSAGAGGDRGAEVPGEEPAGSGDGRGVPEGLEHLVGGRGGRGDHRQAQLVLDGLLGRLCRLLLVCGVLVCVGVLVLL